MDKEAIIKKHWPKPSQSDSITAWKEAVSKMMDEWGYDMIIKFGEYKLTYDLRYDRGLEPEWGKLNYYKQVSHFFDSIESLKQEIHKNNK